jgi:hypothetical protein
MSYRKVEKRLVSGRLGYQNGIRVLVNGSTNDRRPLAPHIAEHAAERIDDYVTQLETIIADLLQFERQTEVVH